MTSNDDTSLYLKKSYFIYIIKLLFLNRLCHRFFLEELRFQLNIGSNIFLIVFDENNCCRLKNNNTMVIKGDGILKFS